MLLIHTHVLHIYFFNAFGSIRVKYVECFAGLK